MEHCLFSKLFVGVFWPSELSHGVQSSSKELLHAVKLELSKLASLSKERLSALLTGFSMLSVGEQAWISRLSIDEHPWSSSRLLLLD